MSPNGVTIREVRYYVIRCGRCQQTVKRNDRSTAEYWATFHDCRAAQHTINYDETAS